MRKSQYTRKRIREKMNDEDEILNEMKKIEENQEKLLDLLRTLYIHGLRTYER